MLPLVAGLCSTSPSTSVYIPTWGLLGAVVATTIATGVATVATLLDQPPRRNAAAAGHDPFFACTDRALRRSLVGTAALLLLMAMAPFSKTLVTAEEREALRQLITTFVRRWNAYWSRAAEQTEPLHAIG